jgi:hypothetical protein
MTSSAFHQSPTRSALFVLTFSRISTVASWLMKRKSEILLNLSIFDNSRTDAFASLVEEPRGTIFNKDRNTLKDMAA